VSISPRCSGCRHAYKWHVSGVCIGGKNCGCLKYERPLSSVRTATPKRTIRPAKKRKTNRAALQRLADKLCGQIVRARGACEGDIHGKGGPLQWAHGFSRRYHATRWLPINGFCLCAGCHFYYGLRPLEWGEFMVKALGLPAYDELRRLALKNEKQDMASVVASLRAECETRGIA
jgi:hypothetical protein